MMNEKYIAGFFDGEGSAMILTIRTIRNSKINYRFRPVIRIVQKNREVLDEIAKFIGFGYVTTERGIYLYVLNGLDGVINFCDMIKRHAIYKKKMLELLKELALFQRNKKSIPYSKEEMKYVLSIRNAVFSLNSRNRDNIKQKYTDERVLNENYFIDDINEWNKNRTRNGVKAMIKHNKENGGIYKQNKNRVV